MEPTRSLVLLDFDGTITKCDTMFEFARFLSGNFGFMIGLIVLFPFMFAHRIGIMSAHHTKELFLMHFLKGKYIDNVELKCQMFANEILPAIIRPGALEAIQVFKKQGARVVIVSASAQDWIIPWATKLDIEVIATKLKVEQGIITGRIQGLNCNGEEKVGRILEKINLAEYNEIIAYGDSKGDGPMLQLATQKYFKPFRNKS